MTCGPWLTGRRVYIPLPAGGTRIPIPRLSFPVQPRVSGSQILLLVFHLRSRGDLANAHAHRTLPDIHQIRKETSRTLKSSSSASSGRCQISIRFGRRPRCQISRAQLLQMAELVALDRGGGWRRRQRLEEEVAVGFRGPLPQRQGPAHPGSDWIGGNQNRLVKTFKTLHEQDQDIISILEKSGRVDLNELLSYRTPDVLRNQDEKIDPVNASVTGIINDMARGRRKLLRMKLKKKNLDISENAKIANDLARWPVDVQELQGKIKELKGRYVRIPQILIEKVRLLS